VSSPSVLIGFGRAAMDLTAPEPPASVTPEIAVGVAVQKPKLPVVVPLVAVPATACSIVAFNCIDPAEVWPPPGAITACSSITVCAAVVAVPSAIAIAPAIINLLTFIVLLLSAERAGYWLMIR
jgi:hypothetical protein